MRQALIAIPLILAFLAGCSHPTPPPPCIAYSGSSVGDGYQAGDVRLTPAATHAAGTIATVSDSDVITFTYVGSSSLTCSSWILKFGDANANSLFDSGEILHVVNGNLTAFQGIRLIAAPYGSYVQAGNADHNQAQTAISARACRIDNGPGSMDDQIILSLNGGANPATGDVVLAGAGMTPGARLTGGLALPFSLCTDFAAALKHADLNGNGAYDAGDLSIIDFPNGGTFSTSSSSASSSSSSSSSITTSSSTSTGPSSGNLTVHVVDVGQGQGIVLEFPDAFVLVDVASRFGSQTAFLNYVASLAPTGIDHMIITNPDADHAAACNELFVAYPVSHFYHPGNVKSTITWNECLDNATIEPGLVTHTDANMNPGDVLPISQHATVRLLNVNASTTNINRGSLALRVDYGQTSWIFAGDMDCTAENITIARGYTLDADLLQVGHHGSKTSSCDPWLQNITPQAAFISVGATNGFGHPTPEALQRLANVGATVYRTDLNGTIIIDTDGVTWNVR